MTPPDENLVALVATVVSFAIVLPLLIKWWPKAIPRPGRKRKPPAVVRAASEDAAPSRPIARQSTQPRPIAARAKTGAAPQRRPTAASARPRRPS